MSVDPQSNYYDAGGIQVIDIMKAKLTPDQFAGFCLGSAMKYLLRANFKHDDIGRDLEKCTHYIKILREEL